MAQLVGSREVMPELWEKPRRSPWAPKMRTKMRPATTGEMEKGRSMRVMRRERPGKRKRAMAQAAASPKRTLRGTVTKSFKWIYGENEINAPMMQAEPFFINRSLRQAGGNERVRRFLRATAHSVRGTSAPHPARGGVEINPECRSYHIGWILYAWAARTDFPEFLHLRGLPAAARS